MVVKVAEYTGTLNCKNCVIVPYSSSTNNNTYCEKHEKPNTNHCASQTSSFYQQNDSGTEQLWHKQFTRWWNWNWQRKRTSLLRKLRKKYFQCDSITKKNILTKNQSVECDLSKDKLKLKENEIKNIYTSSIKNGRLHQLNNDYESNKPIEQFIPVFTKCSSHINQTYKSRRKRNKQKERVYEGWMREVCSSDTESETDVFVKRESKRNSQKNRMHYLSLRLRKLNSGSFSDKSEISVTKTKLTNTENITEYKSPISGKIYNLNLSKTQTFNIKPVETSYAISKSCTDNDFLVKPEFECTAQYYKIRNEHFELLNSICKIVNKQTEDKIVESNLNEESHKTENEIVNEQIVESNFDEESHKTCVVQINSIEEVNLNENFNLYSNMDMPNISKSLPIFMERSPQEVNIIKNDYSVDLYKNESNSSLFDLTKIEDYYYDINYIYNNLDVFKSSITETSFIWDYLEKDKL